MATARHPGPWVRAEALAPKNMSVTAAAKLVGVGRPAFSRFLNGRAVTTPDMASRIERAFGIPASELLDMQAAYDAAQAKAKGVPASARVYVPPFLTLTANDIEAWASNNIRARTRLAVLLRTLVHSTGVGLRNVDFPGNDDGERPGWDGYTDAAGATPWIPQGRTGWEFGTNKDPKKKADKDYEKSVKAISASERKETTFVFVTPRRWAGKNSWANARRKAGKWREVRAYDASDIEQWLEQSVPGQAWFANETQRPSKGVRTLDKCWSNWADVTDPKLNGELFAPSIVGAKGTLLSRLSTKPTEPTIIGADSGEEALAFLAQVFGSLGGDELQQFRDRVLVFEEPGVLATIAEGSSNLIAVTASRQVEREMGSLAQKIHTIIIYPHNAANAAPNIKLQPLDHEAFRKALERMGCSRDEIARFSNESGRSLTVLRRRLSQVPAIRTPEWATEPSISHTLSPFVLLGAWNATNPSDQLVLQLLAEAKSYDVLEKNCQQLTMLNDPPVWSVGDYRGAVSKIDLLFAIAPGITAQDLERFFGLAGMVLGEDDPKLDLPEEQQWAAPLYGKTREFSAALRRGISETLVLLAVHGNELFRSRLGVDCELRAAKLVRDVLTPLNARVLEANDRDLPLYAESAPDEFLSILEQDLSTDTPETFGLMRPASSAIFGRCARTGLLWALETLAWNPATLDRTALVLARLSEIEIGDNWVNTPLNSLRAIFRAWMPQTAATHDQRLAAMKLLAQRFPDVAWKVCVEQLDLRHQLGQYSHKPSWRTDAYGFGEPFPTLGPVQLFVREMIEMALSWPVRTAEMLCDLIDSLRGLPEEHQEQMWKLVGDWAASEASNDEKARVREKIRVTVMSRRAMENNDAATLASAAQDAYQALEAEDVLYRHEWLFRQSWVEESADELDEEDFDIRSHEQRISSLRAEALRAIVSERGMDGVISLAKMGNAAPQIGSLMASDVLQEDQLLEFALKALLLPTSEERLTGDALVTGALRSVHHDEEWAQLIKGAQPQLDEAGFLRLLLLAPFRRTTWLVVDGLDDGRRGEYWGRVEPEWIYDSDDELHEGVERLLKAQRPRAAFWSARLKLEDLRPELLFQLMDAMVSEGQEAPGSYRPEHYDIAKAFARLDEFPDLSLEQRAGLELAYMDVLSRAWNRGAHGIPNLEKYVDTHPEFFVQAVVWAFKRREGGEDPPEWRVEGANARTLAARGYKLLQTLRAIPGRDRLDELKADRLLRWVSTVREGCGGLGRREIGDHCIGKLLSHSPLGSDGVWPCEPVRDVMEEMRSTDLMQGARTGRYNSRGVTVRQEGGGQERELAEQYVRWAESIQHSHPFVASALLLKLAEGYRREALRWDSDADIERRLS